MPLTDLKEPRTLLGETDADAYYREWSAEVTPLRPPKNEEWGARTFDLFRETQDARRRGTARV